MTAPQSTMAQNLLATCDQNGEAAMIVLLSQLAHDSQTRHAWEHSGVCVLQDGAALTRTTDKYEFRWTDDNGPLVVVDRPADFPRDRRRFRWFDHGSPIAWPSGQGVWQDIVEELTEAAVELLDDDIQVEYSEIPEPILMTACPELGDAISNAISRPPPEPPDYVLNQISDDIRSRAYEAVGSLSPEARDRAVQAVLAYIRESNS